LDKIEEVGNVTSKKDRQKKIELALLPFFEADMDKSEIKAICSEVFSSSELKLAGNLKIMISTIDKYQKIL